MGPFFSPSTSFVRRTISFPFSLSSSTYFASLNPSFTHAGPTLLVPRSSSCRGHTQQLGSASTGSHCPCNRLTRTNERSRISSHEGRSQPLHHHVLHIAVVPETGSLETIHCRPTLILSGTGMHPTTSILSISSDSDSARPRTCVEQRSCTSEHRLTMRPSRRRQPPAKYLLSRVCRWKLRRRSEIFHRRCPPRKRVDRASRVHRQS